MNLARCHCAILLVAVIGSCTLPFRAYEALVNCVTLPLAGAEGVAPSLTVLETAVLL